MNKWKANDGRNYYYIDSTLDVIKTTEISSASDKERWEVGNYFKTSDEAETMAKQFKAILDGKDDKLKNVEVEYNVHYPNGEYCCTFSDKNEAVVKAACFGGFVRKVVVADFIS